MLGASLWTEPSSLSVGESSKFSFSLLRDGEGVGEALLSNSFSAASVSALESISNESIASLGYLKVEMEDFNGGS